MKKQQAHKGWAHGQPCGGPLEDRRTPCERVQGLSQPYPPSFAGVRAVTAPYPLPCGPPVLKRTLKTQRVAECPTEDPKKAPQPDTSSPQRVSTALSAVDRAPPSRRSAPSQEAPVAASAPSAAIASTSSQAVGGTVDRPFGTLSKGSPTVFQRPLATSLVLPQDDLAANLKTLRNQRYTALGVRLGARPRTPSNCPGAAAGPAPSIWWLFRQNAQPRPVGLIGISRPNVAAAQPLAEPHRLSLEWRGETT